MNLSKEICYTKQDSGERLRAIFLEAFGLAKCDFSHERAARAMAALNNVRAPLPPMECEVLWLSPPIAFTPPGRYVYISRRFIERCTSDAPVAFALAHEMAHHDLGHLNHADRWIASAFAQAPRLIIVLAVELLARWLYSRENEFAADSRALDLCHKAGFDLKECLRCFDILSQYALDIRDLDGVYGTDEEIELDPGLETNPLGRIYTEWRVWIARHRRSHPCIRERRQILMSRMMNMKPSSLYDGSSLVRG
jgi:Zn-dependent protease with chaperone function